MVLIAYLSMFVDHVFKFLAPNVLSTETITGRIAMPIFMFMIALGMKRTKSKQLYIYRLFIFALVSQIPFILMISNPAQLNLTGDSGLLYKINSVFVFFTNSFNIGFTLLATAILIYALDSKKISNLNKQTLSITILFIAQVLRFDYGAYGVLMGLLFYYIDIKNLWKIVIYSLLLTTAYIIYKIRLQPVNNAYDAFLGASNQYWSILAVPIIYVFSLKHAKKPSKFVRWLKYSIYPIHMLIIFILRVTLFS